MSRDPVPLADSLGAVVRTLRGGLPGPSAQTMGGVFGRWEEAVGEAVARHVQPLKLDGGRLVVEVDDPAWATQLRFLETTLKQRLMTVTGAAVESFEVRVKKG